MPSTAGLGRRLRSTLLVPFLAILLALVVGAVFMALSSPLVNGSFDLTLPFRAYGALFKGAFGSWEALTRTMANANSSERQCQASAPDCAGLRTVPRRRHGDSAQGCGR